MKYTDLYIYCSQIQDKFDCYCAGHPIRPHYASMLSVRLSVRPSVSSTSPEGNVVETSNLVILFSAACNICNWQESFRPIIIVSVDKWHIGPTRFPCEQRISRDGSCTCEVVCCCVVIGSQGVPLIFPSVPELRLINPVIVSHNITVNMSLAVATTDLSAFTIYR